MERDERCEKCRFWDQHQNGTGICRRRAPFPPTSAKDWCGEWEAAATSESYLDKQELVVLP
jgi:hypothetical protein